MPGKQIYKCKFCDYKRIGKGNLKKHTSEEHTKEVMKDYMENTLIFHKCMFCNKRFRSKTLCMKHLFDWHEDKLSELQSEKEWVLD